MHRMFTAACFCSIAGAIGYAIPLGAAGAVIAPASAIPVAIAGASPGVHQENHEALEANVLCHGAESPLVLTLTPLRSVSSSEGASWTVQLVVDNNTDLPVRVRYGVELVDDLGQSAQPLSLSSITPIAQRGSQSFELQTKAGLTDGFYQLRARAVGVGRDGDSSAEGSFYFRAERGELTPLGVNDFLLESRANEGVSP